MTVWLTQQEANSLLALDKHYLGSENYDFPIAGGALRIPVWSADHREEFSLDITGSSVRLEKYTFQNRARKAVILARLDFNGPPHRNPDDEEIPCPHLHLYREGYGSKWAVALPSSFQSLEDPYQLLHEFMDFTRIITKPTVAKGMFP